jgi:hypothetical protein
MMRNYMLYANQRGRKGKEKGRGWKEVEGKRKGEGE